jgi:hypothetical protein
MTTPVEKDGFYYILNSTSKTASVAYSELSKNYSNFNDKDITILPEITIGNEPSTITYDVTSIDIDAFNSSKINSIEIPESITSISNQAFKGSELTTITFKPESLLEIIGDGVFADSKIKSIVIPKSVTSIGINAFDNSSLKSITFEGSKPKFGKNAFKIKNKIPLNPTFGYINECEDSWKGTNYIDNIIIRNTSYYSKLVISVITCLIFLFMLYTSKISRGYKYFLYIIIIISSVILNLLLHINFLINIF